MTIPVIPDLNAGQIAQVADLNAIASACTFLLAKPLARVHDAVGGQNPAVFTAGNPPATNIAFATVDLDTDGMSGTSTKLTIHTPGWYKVRYGVNVSTAGAANHINTGVFSTTGANNPLGAGVVAGPFLPSWTLAVLPEGCAGGSGIFPFYLYNLDFLQIRAGTETAVDTTGVTDAGSFFCLEFVST